MRALLATRNEGKVSDFRDMLSGTGIDLVSCLDYDLPSPDETADDLAGNALIKARAAFAAVGLPTIADDSGFCVHHLGGWPGVRTADLAETGSGQDWDRVKTLIWSRLQEERAPWPRTASFVSAVALVLPGCVEQVFPGEVRGEIVWPPRGELGHDLDPMFRPDGDRKTFGQMTVKEKNAHNSRSQAFRLLMPRLMAHFGLTRQGAGEVFSYPAMLTMFSAE